ncbi:Rrf2 family transcriptional regulator [bacterium]|nr:Rrf2 family transcriptional regulator [bacterium]
MLLHFNWWSMISKTGIHAIKALVALAELPEGSFAGAGAIAESIGAPSNYLGKLLQMFTREGFVVSQKGMGGGFRLAVDPKQISLLDVIDPIDHVGRWQGCFLGRSTCSDENPCTLHTKWKAIRNQYFEFIQGTSIADLIKDSSVIQKIA